MLTPLFYASFVESTLVQIYKKRNADGTSYGGPAFYIFATILVFVGAMASAGTVWNLADMTQGLMVIVNVPVILILAKPAMLCLEDYCRQKKEGKNPVFIAKDAGIDAELDFWKISNHLSQGETMHDVI